MAKVPPGKWIMPSVTVLVPDDFAIAMMGKPLDRAMICRRPEDAGM
jgi:hypothetical protein